MSKSAAFTTGKQRFIGLLIIMLAFLLLAGGWLIPFKFESFSILYKFGPEKAFLRSGKVVGITVAILACYQVLLVSHLTFFKQVFSTGHLLFLHRSNGMVIGTLVILHPLFIKASENFTPYIWQEKYYPEFMGIGMLGVFLLLLLTAVFRNFFRLSYDGWLLLHRLGATLALLFMPAHVLFVSETFKAGLPRNAALITFSLNILLLVRIWLRRTMLAR